MVQIPGPGAAMAIAAAVAVYSAAIADVDYVRIVCLILAAWFSIATLLIERLHKKGSFWGKPS